MIKLYNNNAYNWNKKNEIYTIGYAFYNEKLYEDEEFVNLVCSLKEKIEEEIKKITGFFSIVINEDSKITIISDIARTFPVFYNKNGDVTDDIELLKGELNELSIKELLYSRWVTCDDTIYKDVKQIESAQIVKIDNFKITKYKYFEYEYNWEQKNYSFKILDEVFDNITKKMIKYLNGRTAVIPLSGGQDSRVIAYYLKKNKYTNVIAYTYGNRNGGEVEVSKKVAEFLEIPWYFVEYTTKKCRRKYNKKRFPQLANYYARGYSIPLIQDLVAVDELLSKNIINIKDCVIIPGLSLGFFAGAHIYNEFIENHKIKSKILKQKIYYYNYDLLKEETSIFDKKIEDKLKIKFDNTYIDSKEIAKLFEKYDLEERQVKYIINSVRGYDYYGLKWYIPFLDKELILFWNKVSLKERKRKTISYRLCKL